MDLADYQDIAFAREGKILTITLNRPQRRNAVDARLHEELSRVFFDAAADPQSEVIVLTGAGEAFCAGGDITWMSDALDDPAMFEALRVEAKKLVAGMLECEKPIVCKMNGHAAGLGATIALYSDIIFASDAARISDPHVSVGLVAGDGGAIVWPMLVGLPVAKRYLLTGDPLSAVDAAALGMINEAVPADQLDAKVAAFARRLAGGATQAIRLTKVVANLPLKQAFHAYIDASVSYETRTSLTDDHREAVLAFAEKRSPKFAGS
ncbi:MAG: enoyl-CoA hydratase/isomerase family protein [Roseitalea sp.]|jgi:enoyl-CoA hydratase|nr:enoyl-CoA hydratase/isomerase family protein [Roseitalea sp.]MBO6722047.1 enoyl-CoA hydratase/isomerase family protein [Roseitalea sp.]MBO6741667.1 enoyl-CoA hydratase/isomerase family protein [Roseitalea sp.]